MDHLTPAEREALGPARLAAYEQHFGLHDGMELSGIQIRSTSMVHYASDFLLVFSPLLSLTTPLLADLIARIRFPGPPHPPDATDDEVNIRHVLRGLEQRRGHNSPFVRFHVMQSLWFNLLFIGVSLLTCGVGFLVLAAPFLIYTWRAAGEARQGRWYALPIVGQAALRRYRPV